MKKFIALLILAVAPLMAKHATQFAFFQNTLQSDIAPPTSTNPIEYFAVPWDTPFNTFIHTEGFNLTPSSSLSGLDTITIKHSGWYLVNFTVTGQALAASGSPSFDGLRFGILYTEHGEDEGTLLTTSVYAVPEPSRLGSGEQLVGQVVFFAEAGSVIQLVNAGTDPIGLDSFSTGDSNEDLVSLGASLFITELLGR